MHRLSSALIQAVESSSIVIVSLLATLVPAFAVFAVGGFAGDPLVPWRVAVDAWMLGHGVDVGVTLGDAAVASLGTDAAGAPFVLGIGVWGIGLITLVLAVRSGMRLVQTSAAVWGLAGGTLASAGVGVLLALAAQHSTASPNLVHAAIGPAVCMLAGLCIGMLWRTDDPLARFGAWLTIDDRVVSLARAALRAGFGAAAAFVGLGAVLFAISLIARQADVIVLFEALQPDHLGVAVLWLVQLALLPTAVVWATSWLLGPGFVLGAGSSVSPIGTDLGPVPTLPMLGAIVPGVQPWSLIIVAVPLAAAIAVGALVRQRLARTETAVVWWELAAIALGAGVVAGATLAALSAAASGGIGPGRLADAGPVWWLVGLVAAGTAAVGCGIGLAAGRAGAVLGFGNADDLDRADSSAGNASDAGAERAAADEALDADPAGSRRDGAAGPNDETVPLDDAVSAARGTEHTTTAPLPVQPQSDEPPSPQR